MFRWHQEMTRLDIPAQRVLRLEKSLSDVQVALPGFPAQEATAYLCAFSAAQGIRVAVALHLHQSQRLAYYLNEEGELQKRDATRVYNQALAFAESMGFMMGDLDIHLLPPEERKDFWRALPLAGARKAPSPAGRGRATPQAASSPGAAGTVAADPALKKTAREAVVPAGVDSGTRRLTSAAEAAAARQRILEHLGRFLATL